MDHLLSFLCQGIEQRFLGNLAPLQPALTNLEATRAEIAAFKKAWIQEFVNQSLHRDVPATRRLLAMTLATGKIKKQTDDEVVFWAHPNFGGGTQRTYYLKKVDDRWGIWKIVFQP